MTQTGQDVEIRQGNHRDIRFTLTDDDDSALDLTGVSLSWGIVNGLRIDGEIMAEKTIGSGIAIEGAATNGIAVVSLLPADSADLDGDYIHELRVTDGAGKISTLAVGKLTILPAIQFA